MTLPQQRGTPVVLAFYPGTTRRPARQLCSYPDDLGALTGLGAEVWGISAQDIGQPRLRRKRGLTFPLLADTDKAANGRTG